MSRQVKWRRGTTAEHSTFIGAVGEVTVDTTKDTLVVHDGITLGGHSIPEPRDWQGFTEELLEQAGIVSSGQPDKLGASQRVDAIIQIIGNFKTVVDMLASRLTDGDCVRTLGRFSSGDGGAATYKVFPNGTFTNGVNGHFEGYDYFQVGTLQIGLYHNGVVFPEQFGWVGNWNGSTGTDNTLVINNMIEYCSPYYWDTDQATTRGKIGSIRAKIVGGVGFARITDSVKINPFVNWQGLKVGGFFGQNSGTNIVADFDSNTKYIADTAPIFGLGNRPLGGTYTALDFDGGLTPGCPAWKIDSIAFIPASGRVIKGAFNRQVAQQSSLTNCALGHFGGTCYEGVKSSVCWGGVVMSNHIKASAYALRNETDVTIDIQKYNYLTVGGAAPLPEVYSYILWPNPDLQNKTACIVNLYADPHSEGNICEGAQIGMMSTGGGFNPRDDGNYYEAITEYVYANHTVNLEARPKWVFCAGASMVYLRGGAGASAKIDLSSTSSFSCSGWGLIEAGVDGVSALGYNSRLLPFHRKVSITDLNDKGYVSIYVASGGNDLNSGYDDAKRVKTVQEALARCVPHVKNKVFINDGDIVPTKYNILDNNVTNFSFDSLDVEFIANVGATIAFSESFGETHCISSSLGRVSFSKVSLDLSGAVASGGFAACIRSTGSLDVELDGATVSGSKILLGSQLGEAGLINLKTRGSTLSSGVVLTTNSGSAKTFAWTEVSSGLTSSGSIVGSGSDGKIFSTTY